VAVCERVFGFARRNYFDGNEDYVPLGRDGAELHVMTGPNANPNPNPTPNPNHRSAAHVADDPGMPGEGRWSLGRHPVGALRSQAKDEPLVGDHAGTVVVPVGMLAVEGSVVVDELVHGGVVGPRGHG